MASINTTLLKRIVKATPSSQALLIRGIHGIGKSEIMKQVAEEIYKQPAIVLQGSQLEGVGDLVGLQKIVTNEFGISETVWVAPYWYKKDEQGNVIPVTLILDEINRSTPSIMKSMMQICLEHKLLNMELHPDSHIIACINPGDDMDYAVQEMDDAEKDRFNIYDFAPTVDEWLTYAASQDVLPVIRNYISDNRDELDPYKLTFNGKVDNKSRMKNSNGVSPSRRSWFRVHEVIKSAIECGELPADNMTKSDEDFLSVILAGIIGDISAIKFASYYIKNGDTIGPKMIFDADPDNWGDLSSASKMKGLAKKINTLCKSRPTEAVTLCNSVASYLVQSELVESVNGKNIPTSKAKDMAHNFENFLKSLTAEKRASAYSELVANSNAKLYNMLVRARPTLAALYIDIIDECDA